MEDSEDVKVDAATGQKSPATRSRKRKREKIRAGKNETVQEADTDVAPVTKKVTTLKIYNVEVVCVCYLLMYSLCLYELDKNEFSASRC